MNPKEIFEQMLPEGYDTIKAEICYQNSIRFIEEYTKQSNVEEKFQYPLILLAYHFFKSFNDMNVSSITQGNRSITYDSSKIPTDIKDLLPKWKTVKIL